MSDFTDDIFDIGDEHPNTPSWILFFVVVIFGLWYLSSCKDPQPKYPATGTNVNGRSAEQPDQQTPYGDDDDARLAKKALTAHQA